MPRLSDSMEEGTILKWLKSDGEAVARGEELVEIETDKATMTYEADAAGVLTIIAAEGDTLPIGAPIATIGETAARPTPPASENGDAPAPARGPRGRARPGRARARRRLRSRPCGARRPGQGLAAGPSPRAGSQRRPGHADRDRPRRADRPG